MRTVSKPEADGMSSWSITSLMSGNTSLRAATMRMFERSSAWMVNAARALAFSLVRGTAVASLSVRRRVTCVLRPSVPGTGAPSAKTLCNIGTRRVAEACLRRNNFNSVTGWSSCLSKSSMSFEASSMDSVWPLRMSVFDRASTPRPSGLTSALPVNPSGCAPGPPGPVASARPCVKMLCTVVSTDAASACCSLMMRTFTPSTSCGVSSSSTTAASAFKLSGVEVSMRRLPPPRPSAAILMGLVRSSVTASPLSPSTRSRRICSCSSRDSGVCKPCAPGRIMFCNTSASAAALAFFKAKTITSAST